MKYKGHSAGGLDGCLNPNPERIGVEVCGLGDVPMAVEIG
ncbi:hypothetical protein MBEBAB_2569 [Brevundimonas abyssalis TAR-001]|uniref:Uncharacterized protein n=1 Tax=Brevundimonas abyssalis TAR-001 TaxID=1391729 RepID=A0A8E0NDJ2_9CAUL|nr:hypothetical protein MBEBAB_2569 [Brevundimonas abyssalis TAR-001]